jgi:hypothetical protein
MAAGVRLSGNAIMREAKLRGLGVAIAVEMFNTIILTNPEIRYHLTSLGRMVVAAYNM